MYHLWRKELLGGLVHVAGISGRLQKISYLSGYFEILSVFLLHLTCFVPLYDQECELVVIKKVKIA